MTSTCKDILLIFLICFLSILLLYISSNKGISVNSVPYNYHTYYDENGKMLIVPEEYHSEYVDGRLILTK